MKRKIVTECPQYLQDYSFIMMLVWIFLIFLAARLSSPSSGIIIVILMMIWNYKTESYFVKHYDYRPDTEQE